MGKLIGVYLLFTFVKLDPNIFNWTEATRLTMILTWLLVVGMPYLLISDPQTKNKHD